MRPVTRTRATRHCGEGAFVVVTWGLRPELAGQHVRLRSAQGTAAGSAADAPLGILVRSVAVRGGVSLLMLQSTLVPSCCLFFRPAALVLL